MTNLFLLILVAVLTAVTLLQYLHITRLQVKLGQYAKQVDSAITRLSAAIDTYYKHDAEVALLRQTLRRMRDKNHKLQIYSEQLREDINRAAAKRDRSDLHDRLDAE